MCIRDRNKILAGKPVTNAEYSQMGDLVQAGMQTVNSPVSYTHLDVYKRQDTWNMVG